MNVWAKFLSVVVVFSSGLSVYAADKKMQEEHEILIKMMQEVPVAQMEIYHSNDWQDLMKISQSHWGDSTGSLNEKFDSIIGEKGTFTQFYTRVFKDPKSLHLLQQAYVGWQCLKLITHFNTHSKGTALGWFRAPYEIDVITKLELYAIRKDIPLFHCYHQQLGYDASHFSGIERMNEELIKKLEQQEEKERKIRHEEAEQKRIANIPAAPAIPLDFNTKKYARQIAGNAAESSDAKKVDMSKTKGAIQTLSPTQLQEALNKKLKHVSAEDLIRPIPETEFSSMFKAITARRPQIEGNDSLPGETDNSDFD